MALSDTIKPQDREVISLKEVAERLRYLRESVKLSQVKMAEVVGEKQSSLNRYELNQASPTFETLTRYADYFDVSMDYLYCRTDEPRGKLYDYQPERLKGKNIQNQELRDFIEMCFDPQAPVNKRLKEALFRIMEEGQEKT